MKEKKHFYTDGKVSIKLSPNSEIPEGFHPGRTFKVSTWNKGLKACTDERVRKNHENSVRARIQNGSYVSWNKGLTKENNESLKRVSEKVSEARKGKSSWNKGIPMKESSKEKLSKANKGKQSWNKGLTKETDSRLLGTSLKQKGHRDYVTDWNKAKEKEYLTHKKNNSFNTSKPEDITYDKLCSIYGKENVIRQYRCVEYPHNCDFYIVSKKLFIEVNDSWTHGKHPFDKNNKEDIKILNEWKQRATSSSYYAWAIKVWTEKDVQKLNELRTNKLNFQLLYPDNLIIEK